MTEMKLTKLKVGQLDSLCRLFAYDEQILQRLRCPKLTIPNPHITKGHRKRMVHKEIGYAGSTKPDVPQRQLALEPGGNERAWGRYFGFPNHDVIQLEVVQVREHADD